ncbi:S8 family serine peptidase [Amycolatopsis benzoatilytica]|uniref:S8 family serine peptidase n=1 Tax=Amycolatopsis benzoatilytica TaxID=346045 RepID=UPI0003AA72AB|nr:S8 family serine peptidase [Amycolatopsis benzoatilytica]
MTRTPKWTGVAAAVAVAASTFAVPATAAPASRPADRAGVTDVGSLTLITGDQVAVRRLGNRTIPQVRPGLGRAKMPFVVTQAGGHTYVVPSDARRLLDSGKLDRRFFDVTTLLAQGFGDTARDNVPLIVRGAESGRVASMSTGATVTADLSSVRAKAVRQPKARVGEFWHRLVGASAFAAGVDKIWLDGKVSATLKDSVPQIGAPKAWQAGFTGKGVKVAVLDTGVDAHHPDLRGRIAETRNFSDTPDAVDHQGHGTHVASTIAGNGQYKGVAPDASLLIGKVLDDHGGGTESAIIAGMQWAAEQGARLVNMSLGGEDDPGVDPMEQAVNDLSAKYHTLFVIAAGNSGPGAGSLGSPGTADSALTVGAVDKSDKIAQFSSRGPRAAGGTIKPDLTAPGVGIVAARAAGTSLGTVVDAQHTMLNGTSMASPHVAGAAALLAQQHPDWTGEQLKAALMGSARPDSVLDAFTQGAGRVDVGAAVAQPVYTTPASVSGGRPPWPHHDDKPAVTPVTYHNAGSTTLKLDLSIAAKSADGTPAPAGMFTVDKSTAEVPAGGTVTVNVTINTAVASPDGVFTGRITAAGNGVSVITPVAVEKEPESYSLTLKYLDRNGNAPRNYAGTVDGVRNIPFDGRGTTTIRLPKGKHELSSVVYTTIGGDEAQSLVYQPVLDLTRDTTIVVDARQAKPISVAVDSSHQGVVPVSGAVALIRPESVLLMQTSGLHLAFVQQVGPPLPDDRLTVQFAGGWAQPSADGDPGKSPVTYTLSWFQRGKIPNGFSRRVRDSDLVQVRADYRSLPQRYLTVKSLIAVPHGDEFGVGPGWPVAPSLNSRTEYFNADRKTDWYPQFTAVDRESGRRAIESTGTPLDGKAGRSYPETWNAAVVGPALPANGLRPAVLRRTGNEIQASLPLFSDSPNRFSDLPAEGATTLYRDGKKVASTATPGRGTFAVPAGNGNYRLETMATQTALEFSTKVSAAWTFKSGNQPGSQALPAQAIRFAPNGLDRDNRAASGRSTVVPVSVQRYGDAAPLDRLTVEVSFDDGATWQAVQVTGSSGTVAHPGKPGYVSLRAKAVDKNGDSVEQTVIRAYGLK